MTATTTRKPANKPAAKGRDSVLSLIARVATALGKETRKSLEETEPAHAAYVKANEDRQQAMRHAWTNAYMASHLNVSTDIADTLRAAPRFGAKAKTVDGKTIKPRTREQQQAYDRARKLFSFHISRDDKRIGAGASAPKVRKDRQVQAAIEGVCAKVFAKGLTVQALETLRDQIALMIPEVRKAEKEAAAA